MDTPKQARCELCQSGSLEDFLVPDKLQILKCPECGLYQKGISLVGVDYASDYHEGYDRRRASKVRTAQVRLSRLTRLTGPASGRLLDVGCSVGCTLEAAARMGEATVRNTLSVLDGQPNYEMMLNKEVLGSAAPPAATNNSE